jgi:hypothetical protein
MLSRQGTESDQQISGTQGLEPLMLLGSIVMLDYLNGDNRRNIMKQSKIKQNCQMMIESLKALNDTWNQAQTAEGVSQKFTGAFNILRNRFPAAESTNVAEIKTELARHLELDTDFAKPIDLSNLDFAHYLNQEIAFSKRMHTGRSSVSDFYSATFSRIWSFLIENLDHVVNDSGYTCFFSAICHLHHFSSIKEQSAPDASKTSSYQHVYQILDQITDLASYRNPVSESLIQEFKNKFRALSQVIQDSGVGAGALEMLQQASSQCQQLLSGENIVSINDLKTIVEKQVLQKIEVEVSKESKVMADKANGHILQKASLVFGFQAKFIPMVQGPAYVQLKAYFAVNQLQLVEARSQQELQVAVAGTRDELKQKLILQSAQLDSMERQLQERGVEIIGLKFRLEEAKKDNEVQKQHIMRQQQLIEQQKQAFEKSQESQQKLLDATTLLLSQVEGLKSENAGLKTKNIDLEAVNAELEQALLVESTAPDTQKSKSPSALSARSANSLFGPNK